MLYVGRPPSLPDFWLSVSFARYISFCYYMRNEMPRVLV